MTWGHMELSVNPGLAAEPEFDQKYPGYDKEPIYRSMCNNDMDAPIQAQAADYLTREDREVPETEEAFPYVDQDEWADFDD